MRSIGSRLFAIVAFGPLCLLGANVMSRHVVVLDIGAKPTHELAERVANIARARLKAVEVGAQVAVAQNDTVEVVLDNIGDLSERSVEQLLEARGEVVLRVDPGGAMYVAPTPRLVKNASVSLIRMKSVVFEMSDPSSFKRFTTKNVGKNLALFLDGKRLLSAYLVAPIECCGEIEFRQNDSVEQVEITAAILNSGPYPVIVKLSASTLN